MVAPQIDIQQVKIAEFCKKWRITEFALFGSVLREDFGSDSDIDVLVTFDPDAPWSLWELIDMKFELQAMFGRDVDLVEKQAIRNPWRRSNILRSHEVIYAA